MAQLRDAQTSELLAEGTPLELALLADELGRSEVIFDGVGLDFNADAVLEDARARVAELERAAGAGELPAALDDTAPTKAAAELELDRERVDQAARELEAARGRLE